MKEGVMMYTLTVPNNRVSFEDREVQLEKHFENGVAEGIEKAYYKNGQLRNTVSFHKGLKEGIAIFYNENGSLMFEENYLNSLLTGIKKVYDEKGELVLTAEYENNKLNGLLILYEQKEEAVRIVFENGKAIEGYIKQRKVSSQELIELTKKIPVF